MLAAMAEAQVDVTSPAAVAILGMRGDVTAWGKRHGVEPNDNWVLDGYIPGMMGHGRLVYPHLRNGRLVYLSARGIVEKFHYNLPEALVGKRQPFFNQHYAPKAESVVIVEGQADAITLGQWGLDAVALAGVAPGEELAAMLERHQAVYIGLDADEAGQKNAWKVADAMGPKARLLRWQVKEYRNWRGQDGAEHEVKDANDLLRAMVGAGVNDEAQRAEVRGMLHEARTYAETIAAWAGALDGAPRDEAMVKALQVISKLGELDFAQYRNDLAKLLRVGLRELQAMLKAYQSKAAEKEAQGEPVYTWGGPVGDHLVEYLYDVKADKAMLAWRDPDGQIHSGSDVVIDGQRYVPYPPNETLRSGAIVFASGLGDRKSIKELITYIEMYLKNIYLLPSDQAARLIAYWILLTWVYDSFETCLYLRAMGGAGSGKSELMKRIGMICYRTMTANGAGSTSSLFRAVERYQGVCFLDEADLQNSDTEQDMIKFYNLGAMRGNPIWRTVEVIGPNGTKDFEERAFRTFCPKLIAMRKDFRDDAVGSRSLTFKLAPREMTELVAAKIPLTVNDQVRERAQALRNLLLRFRMETWLPEIPVDQDFYDLTISARLNQVAGPLLAIAKDDPEQQDAIRSVLREYYAETIVSAGMTLDARVIEALWKIWQYPDLNKKMVKPELDGTFLIKVGDVTKITNEIVNEMNDEDEEDNNKAGKEIKSQRIGRILRSGLNFQVTPRRRDGFYVVFNEPKLIGLSNKYGINREDFGPKPGEAQQGTLKNV